MIISFLVLVSGSPLDMDQILDVVYWATVPRLCELELD